MRFPQPALLALFLTLALVASGCLGRTPAADKEEDAEDLEPTDFAPEPAPSPAPSPGRAPNASAPGSAPGSSGSNTSLTIDPPANTTTPVPSVAVTTWEGSVTGVSPGTPSQAPALACCQVAEASGENTVVTFDVPAGLSAIVVELTWTQGQPPADLDLVLDASDVAEPAPPSDPTAPAAPSRTGHWWTDGEGTPAETTATARIVVTDAEALALTGTWTWRVMPKGPANAVPFVVAVSLFTGAAPADDYTALATPSGNP